MTKRTTKKATRKETPFTNTGKAIERKDMTIITDSLEYTIFKDYRFEATTTMEYLSEYGMNCYNSILLLGNHVVFAARNYKGETRLFVSIIDMYSRVTFSFSPSSS